MMFEIAILYRLQTGHEQRRQLLQLDDAPFLLRDAVERSDACGFKTRFLQSRVAVGVSQPGDAGGGERHRDAPARDASVEIDERAARDHEALAAFGVRAGLARVLAFDVARCGK